MRDELKPGDYGYRRKRNINLSDRTEDQGQRATGINWAGKRVANITDPILHEVDLEEYVSASAYQQDIEDYNYDEIIEEDELLQDNGRTKERAKENSQEGPTKIGKKAINLEKLKVKKQQQEMERVTIYLDKNLLTVLKMLKRENRINSYSQCIKDALEEYLTT